MVITAVLIKIFCTLIRNVGAPFKCVGFICGLLMIFWLSKTTKNACIDEALYILGTNILIAKTIYGNLIRVLSFPKVHYCSHQNQVTRT